MKSPAFRFYPSDFWGSPDVQAMDLHEVGAYLSLLSNAWLSERPGCLPDDPERLRRWARMTREQWEQSGRLLLSKFPVFEDGWRANPRLRREVERAEAFSVAQSKKGQKGGRPKAGEKPGVSFEKPGVSVGITPEKPSVSVSASVSKAVSGEVEKQLPSSKAKALKVKKTPDPRHSQFKGAFEKYFRHRNPSLADVPWDGQEAAQLNRFLKKNPNLTLDTWQLLLTHRGRSPVSHTANLSAWIARALDWIAGPTDAYGKQTIGGNNAKPGKCKTIADSTQQTLILREQRRLGASAHSPGGSIDTEPPTRTPSSGFDGRLMARNS